MIPIEPLSSWKGQIKELLVVYSDDFNEENMKRVFGDKMEVLNAGTRVLFLIPAGKVRKSDASMRQLEKYRDGLRSFEFELNFRVDPSSPYAPLQAYLQERYLKARFDDAKQLLRADPEITFPNSGGDKLFGGISREKDDQSEQKVKAAVRKAFGLKKGARITGLTIDFLTYGLDICKIVNPILQEAASKLQASFGNQGSGSRPISFSSMMQTVGCNKFWSRSGPYVQDPFLILREAVGEGNQTYRPLILEPWCFGSLANQHVAEVLSDGEGIPIKSTSISLEGGNVLAADGCLLVGKDVMRDTHAQKRKTDPNFGLSLKEFEKDFKKKLKRNTGASQVHVLGFPRPRNASFFWTRKGFWYSDTQAGKVPTFQPLYHLDLFLTLGPVQDGKQVVLLAKVHKGLIYRKESYLKALQKQPNIAQKEVKVLKTLDRWFKEMEGLLASLGFRVYRIPMGMQITRDSFIPLSFNNALVECYWEEDNQRVCLWVPHYKVMADYYSHDNQLISPDKEMDKMKELVGQEIENALGKEAVVKFMPFYFFAKSRGALHCRVKVLQRS